MSTFSRSLGAMLALACTLSSSGCLPEDEENACNRAAELCGEQQDIDDDRCVGTAADYAGCILERDQCDPATIVECAGMAVDGGTVNPPNDASTSLAAALRILGAELDGSYFDVRFEITNEGEATPIPIATGLFYVEDDRGRQYTNSGGICGGATALAAGGSERCDLQYSVPQDFRAVRLIYRDPLQREVSAAFSASSCAFGSEGTEAACSDGCSNDGDKFVDCDDYDCCSVRACPANSACGTR